MALRGARGTRGKQALLSRSSHRNETQRVAAARPYAYRIVGTFAHSGVEFSSFNCNVATAVSLAVDDIPSAQNSLHANSFPTRQAAIPCALSTSGSLQ
jgi:hypothetical protein